jgi:hypothetical protein
VHYNDILARQEQMACQRSSLRKVVQIKRALCQRVPPKWSFPIGRHNRRGALSALKRHPRSSRTNNMHAVVASQKVPNLECHVSASTTQKTFFLCQTAFCKSFKKKWHARGRRFSKWSISLLIRSFNIDNSWSSASCHS